MWTSCLSIRLNEQLAIRNLHAKTNGVPGETQWSEMTNLARPEVPRCDRNKADGGHVRVWSSLLSGIESYVSVTLPGYNS